MCFTCAMNNRVSETISVKVTLAGRTVDWLRWNSSWGVDDEPADEEARHKILTTEHKKVGAHGFQVVVDLTPDEAQALWGILESLAALGESMTGEERGDDAGNYRQIRKDADRLDTILISI